MTNTGSTNVVINLATVAGNGFEMSGLTFPMTLTSKQSASLNVRFAPTTGGAATGSITFTDNAPGSPQTVSLVGSGVATSSTLAASPASVSFGNVAVGSNGQQTITLTNTGNASATISAVSSTGSGFTVLGLIDPNDSGGESICQLHRAVLSDNFRGCDRKYFSHQHGERFHYVDPGYRDRRAGSSCSESVQRQFRQRSGGREWIGRGHFDEFWNGERHGFAGDSFRYGFLDDGSFDAGDTRRRPEHLVYGKVCADYRRKRYRKHFSCQHSAGFADGYRSHWSGYRGASSAYDKPRKRQLRQRGRGQQRKPDHHANECRQCGSHDYPGFASGHWFQRGRRQLADNY